MSIKSILYRKLLKSGPTNGQYQGTELCRRKMRTQAAGRALETLCAILRLGGADGQDATLSAAICESRVDWQTTIALAGRHLLLPALWPALAGKKMAQSIPQALRQFFAERGPGVADSKSEQNVFLLLEEWFTANAARNRAIRAQLGEILAALNAADVVPGLIKGGRLLLAGDWPYSAGRILRDIDLLLPPGDWAAGVATLTAIGYSPVLGDISAPRRGGALTRPGEHAEIDLHIAPLSLHEPLPLPGYLTAAGFWHAAETVCADGSTYRRLPAAESMVHGIVHTEIADLNHAAGDWALRYLYETAVLTRDLAHAPDWSVLRALAGSPLFVPLQAHLEAARALFGATLPEDFAPGKAARRQFRRCRRNLLHPRSLRRFSFLVHKLRQAMSEWYLRRKGYYPDAAGGAMGLWRARLRMLRDVGRRYGTGLLRAFLGGDDDPLPPPRV